MTQILVTDANILNWLPGDIIEEDWYPMGKIQFKK